MIRRTPTECSANPSPNASAGRATRWPVALVASLSLLSPPALAPAEPIDAQLFDLWGARTFAREQYGLELNVTWQFDYSHNLRGGLDTQGSAFRNLFGIDFQYDLGTAIGVDGLLLGAQFQNQSGQSASDEVGDIQGLGNNDADGRTQLSQLYVQQQLFDGRVTLEFGKRDANAIFAAPDYGGEFINSSFGLVPTVFALPTYPDPAVGLNVMWSVAEPLTISYGLYDGAGARGIMTGDRSPKTVWEKPHDLFQIVQVDWHGTTESGLAQRLAVGMFHSNARFETFSGGSRHGSVGAYVIAEQQLFAGPFESSDPEATQPGLYAFAQYGWADDEVCDFAHTVAAGLWWVGPFQKDTPDTLGIGFTTVFLSDAAGAPFTSDHETAIELFYDWHVSALLSIKPDIQYIINPGGDASVDDALAATLRVTLSF